MALFTGVFFFHDDLCLRDMHVCRMTPLTDDGLLLALYYWTGLIFLFFVDEDFLLAYVRHASYVLGRIEV